ncbi:MAG: hypothetical protein K5868_04480 [Lachnospiraceae bacterium]|nr:hypothetical protein [Lachnospiraceae bacterium]
MKTDRCVIIGNILRKTTAVMLGAAMVCSTNVFVPDNDMSYVMAAQSDEDQEKVTAGDVLVNIGTEYLTDELGGLCKDLNYEVGEMLLGEAGGIGYYVATDMILNEVPDEDEPKSLMELMELNYNPITFTYEVAAKDKVEDKVKDGIRKGLEKKGLVPAKSGFLDKIDGILEPTSEAVTRIVSTAKDSDACLQAILAASNWTSDIVENYIDPIDGKAPVFIKNNPLVHGSQKILAFSNSLWDTLLESKEYKDFRDKYKTKDEFNRAFLATAGQGIIDALADIPRELGFGKKNAGTCFDCFDANTRRINSISYDGGRTAKKAGEADEHGIIDDIDAYYGEHPYRDFRRFDTTDQLSLRVKPASGVSVYKPNIYIYDDSLDADQTRKLHIDFIRPNRLLKTIPEYDPDDGWDVLVSKDGRLTLDDNTYDYLFYESRTDLGGVQTEYGFKIPVKDRRDALSNAIEGYVFNAREREDFLDFWCDKLEPDTDYVMYPQDTDTVDKMMPLDLSDEPDSIRRIWYAFAPDTGQNVEQFDVEPITRGGLTIVEWGGFFLE